MKLVKKLSRISLSATIILGAIAPQIPSSAATSVKIPASFTINGSGFGHGVGLSQYGSRGMALAGYKAEQIVAHYYVGTTIATQSSTQDLRVGLAQDQSYVAIRSEALGGAGGKMTISMGSNTRTIPANTPVVFSISSSTTRATFADGSAISGTTATVTWNGVAGNADASTVINVANGYSSGAAKTVLGAACKDYFAGAKPSGFDSCPHRYRYGIIEIAGGKFGDTSRDLNVVNKLRLGDEYLYGIGEVPSSWEADALGAQVIAARSYAYATYLATISSGSAVSFDNTKVRAACLCHMYSTIADQNYVGFNKEYSTLGTRWVSAVKASIPKAGSGKGKVILYKGNVIKAFFSSATGGASQPIKEVWGATTYPWSSVVDDHWALDPATGNPNIKWAHTIKQGELVRNLNNVGVPIKNVKSFKVSTLYASGGVSKLSLTDASGKVTAVTVGPNAKISPDSLRWVLGVKSTYLRSIKASTSLISVPTPKPSVSPSNSVTPTPTKSVTPTPTPTPLRTITKLVWPKAKISTGSYSITGGLDPIQKNVTVTLNQKVGETWSAIATTKSGLDGSWVLGWDDVQLGSHTLKVVAANNAGKIESTEHVSVATPQITIGGPTSARINRPLTVRGNLIPTTASVVVQVSRRIGNGSWKVVRTTKSTKKGVWSIKCGVGPRVGIVRFKAQAIDPVLGTFTTTPLEIVVR